MRARGIRLTKCALIRALNLIIMQEKVLVLLNIAVMECRLNTRKIPLVHATTQLIDLIIIHDTTQVIRLKQSIKLWSCLDAVAVSMSHCTAQPSST